MAQTGHYRTGFKRRALSIAGRPDRNTFEMTTAMLTTILHPLRRLPALALAAALLAPAAWAAPFVDNNDGTVTDQATGLMWDRCAWGQTGADCSGGSAAPSDWAQALAAAQSANAQPDGYKGCNDWRLPNKNELESLVKIDGMKAPYIDDDAFLGTPDSGDPSVFWSSTTYAPDPAAAWNVYFDGGGTGAIGKANTYSVRLVRSGQSLAFFDSLDTTAPNITAGPTATPGADGTSASASVTVDEAATGWWLVRPAADATPTVATLQASGTAILNMKVGMPADFSLTGLAPGTAYKLHFVAQDGGNNDTGVQSVAFTTPNVPGTPTGITATPGVAGSGTVQVSWTAPADNGSAITGYTVSPAGTGPACPASPCTISGLTNAAQYTFTVAAANGVGTGQDGASTAVWLQGTQAITFPVQATASRAYAPSGTFAIDPQASATSLLAVSYGSQNGAVCTVSGTTVTMAGAGACVIEAAQAGSAAWAAAAPVTQTVTIGGGVNSVTFQAQAGQTFVPSGTFAISPAATGSSSKPITYSSLTPTVCTVAGTTVTMVSAGTCTLAANQAGDANWGAAPQATQTVQIAPVVPGAPTGVTATPTGLTQVTVRWTAPANDGGGITLYTVRALVNGVPSGQTCTAAPPATECTVAGLEPGKTYTFTVEATNGAGGTAAPAPTNPATPLADAKVFSAPAPTGTGTVAVAVAGGGATCAFESVQLLPANGTSTAPPANVQFPHGLLDFVLAGCDQSNVTVTITYPSALPQGVQYWKLRGGAWAPYASATMGGVTTTLTLNDGGPGDDDGNGTNGRIVDPGGMGVMAAVGPGGAAAIPTLSQWGLVLLGLLLGLGAWGAGGRLRPSPNPHSASRSRAA